MLKDRTTSWRQPGLGARSEGMWVRGGLDDRIHISAVDELNPTGSWGRAHGQYSDQESVEIGATYPANSNLTIAAGALTDGREISVITNILPYFPAPQNSQTEFRYRSQSIVRTGLICVNDFSRPGPEIDMDHFTIPDLN